MGYVWNVMISFDNDELWDGDEPLDDCIAIERINDWIGTGRLVSMVSPTYAEDAGYGMDANLYGGGFKHFDIDGFVAVVKAQDWKAREKVQLWIKGGEEGMWDDPFTLVSLGRRPRKAARGVAAGNSVDRRSTPQDAGRPAKKNKSGRKR